MTPNFSRSTKPAATDLDWMDAAACKGEDLSVFFPTSSKGPGQEARVSEHAKVICRGCPVRTRCLDYALSFSATQLGLYGVWGATTRRERLALLNLDRQMSA